jgi:hypothetical protein
MKQKSNPSIFDMDRTVNAYDTSSQLRLGILNTLIGEQEWCAAQKQLLTKAGANPENLPYPGPDKNYVAGQLLITREDFDLNYAKALFELFADKLQVTTQEVDDIDLIASIVALEIWSALFYLEDADNLLECAISEGPDAVNSLSAILARGCGHGVMVMPADPEFADCSFETKILFQSVSRARTWASNYVSDNSWFDIQQRVITDLGYNALGGTRTHNASLLLGLCMSNIQAE